MPVYSGSDVESVCESRIFKCSWQRLQPGNIKNGAENTHTHTCRHTIGTALCVSNCKGWAEESVIECLWWDKHEANWQSTYRSSLLLKFLLIWHWNFFSSALSRGVAAFQTDTLKQTLAPHIVSERQWDESTTLDTSQSRRESRSSPQLLLF